MHGSFGNSFSAAALATDVEYSEGHWRSHCGIAGKLIYGGRGVVAHKL